ncbi:MAG: hypothetical protein LBO66_09240 [Deltaproteobacteria bacterium]|jgi:hypothetical protein|nr:hypothetical protein [Deltaproteobacteria bacterium]
MKALIAPALAALLLTFLLPSCSPTPPRLSSLVKYAPCDGRGYSNIARLDRGAFAPAAQRSCVQSVDPVDVSAWLEAPLASYRQRGLQTMVLGCANLAPDFANCQYSGIPGHSSALSLNFNFAVFPLAARVQKAILAVYVDDNGSYFTRAAEVRGRLNIGDQLQSLGAVRLAPTGRTPGAGWAVFDITDFAARAINEQRTSASFEISLPCGRDESELTTVRVLKTEPVIVVEYK